MTTAALWPTMLDYREAIAAGGCFTDPDLAAAQPRTNAQGLPWPATGGYASVYQLNGKSRSWAVRCFLREPDPTVARRYEKISAHLRMVGLEYSTDFTYLPDGVRVAGVAYPIVKVAWIEGSNLNSYVEDLVLARDREALRRLALEWRQMLAHLEAAQLAHGDLQHGNVRIEPSGRLRLIDYDGMWVPALQGMPATEGGHPSYQHPHRGSAFDVLLDRFPGLVITCALAALSEDTSLWSRYDNGDNLLFTKADLTDPANSSLLNELQASTHLSLVTLAAAVVSAATADYVKTPRLTEITLLRARPSSAQAARRNEQSRAGSPGTASQGVPSWVRDHLGAGRESTLDLSLTAAWSRPGTVTKRWTEHVPVYGTDTILVTREFRGGFLWLKKKRAVEPRERQVQTGTRSVQREAESQVSGPTGRIAGVAFIRPDRREFAAATADGELWVWRFDSRDPVSRRPVHAKEVTSLAAHGDRLVTSSADKTLALWDLQGAGPKQTLTNTSGSWFYDVACSPDGRYVAGGLGRQAIRVFDLSSGGKPFDLVGHRRKVRAVAFASSRWLVSGSDDATVRVWDIGGRKCHVEFSDHIAEVNAVAGSTDGRLVASGGMDEHVIVYELDAVRPARVAHYAAGHSVRALGFAVDNRHLFVGAGEDIQILDCITGRIVKKLAGHRSEVTALDATRSGLLSGDAAGLVVYWTADRKLAAIRLDQVSLSVRSPRPTRPPPSRAHKPSGSPICPRCHRAMVRRSQKAPPYRPFWGCTNFPRCKATRNI